MIDLDALKALDAKATKGPLELAVIGPDCSIDEQVELYRKHLSYGGQTIWAVWCPEHTLTTIGQSRERPEHAVLFAIVGNGPDSESNAELIVAARTAVPELIAEIATLRALVVEAMDFNHAAGCSGAIGNRYRCKCGRREWLAKAKKALGEEGIE